ncbi:zinc ribbon domain-containing protein [Polynucleobacter paneuropaeus]|nr:zinc ribbon domain-containing protein [Polynucleobacter paneuropaeus]
MALFECIECGHRISDSAGSCPNCGFNIKKAKWDYIFNESWNSAKQNVESQSAAYKFVYKIFTFSSAALVLMIAYSYFIKSPADQSEPTAQIMIYLFLIAGGAALASNILRKK